MLTTSATYRLIARDLDRSLEQKAAETSIARETDYYLENISNIKNVDDFIKNTRVFGYAMKAFGLEDMTYAKAYMRKILVEGIDDPNSLANRVADDRFLRFATVFNFQRYGEATMVTTGAGQGTVDRYVRQALEASAGEDNEGVRLALYFLREAPKVKSAYDLLADPALWQVVKTVFGFPTEMANAAIEKQAAAVLQRLDLDDLKDPAKLDQLITRFTAVYDVTEVTTQDPVLSLFDLSAPSASVGLDLILKLGNLRRGGS
jgi:hypothetical protein